MNIGVVALILLGAWTLLSIIVSVTVGGIAGDRDDDRALFARFDAADVETSRRGELDRERRAS
jgi:hypothetical protein